MENALHDLTKHVFYELLNKAGRVYLLVKHSPDVVLGSREFTPEEKERGIMLVFNSRMKFAWDAYGISATLVFGTTPQHCFIPFAAVGAVFSPDLGAQFSLAPRRGGIAEGHGHEEAEPRSGSEELRPDPLFAEPARTAPVRSRREQPEGRLIRVDFAKKLRKRE